MVDITIDGPDVKAPPTADEEAPWGYKPDGTPYRRDPARYDKMRKTPRAGAKPSRKAAPYVETVEGLLQLACVPLVAAGARNDALLADAAAVGQHAQPIARAVGDLAAHDQRVAAVLDRIAAVGPYGILLTAVTPLVVQVLANHRVVPSTVAIQLGAVDPDQLVDAIHQEAERVASQNGDG